MKFTQEEMIASGMAMRNYSEITKPIADSLTTKRSTKGYKLGLLVAILIDLDNTGEDAQELAGLAVKMLKDAKVELSK